MTHFTGETVTVDARDLVDDLETEQERILDEEERLATDDEFDITDSEFVALDDDETVADVSDTQLREHLKKEYQKREHQIDELETRFAEWGGSRFAVKHLTAGDEARIDDRVAAKAIAEEQSDPRTQAGAARLITVAVGLVNVPGEPAEGALTKQEGIPYVREQLPSVLVRWLYDRIENLTNYGEASLQDFSPFPDRTAADSALSSSDRD